MSNVLFINQPSIGHLNVLLSIALQMKADGHDVRFLVPSLEGAAANIAILDMITSVPRRAEEAGVPADIIPLPLSALLTVLPLPMLSGYNELAWALRFFSTGMASYTRHLVNHIERTEPDALVADYTFFAAHLAAELTETPCAAVYHTGLPFKGEEIPPFGSGLPIARDALDVEGRYARRESAILRRLDRRINRARLHFGLPPYAPDVLRYPYAKWLNLVTTTEAIEAPRDNLTSNTFFIGPCFAHREANGHTPDFPFDVLRDDAYKVYVSLGTVFNNKPQVFRKIMAALDDPTYQVIVSAGGTYDKLASKGVPENVMLFRRVPQLELLPHVDLVIGHGGNNSTNETLAAGNPLIVMPIGGEQRDNASRVEYLGAGLRLDIARFSEPEIAAKVRVIQTSDYFDARAKALQQAIAKTDGPTTASRLIEAMARTQAPVRRPDDFPVTVTRKNRAALFKQL